MALQNAMWAALEHDGMSDEDNGQDYKKVETNKFEDFSKNNDLNEIGKFPRFVGVNLLFIV